MSESDYLAEIDLLRRLEAHLREGAPPILDLDEPVEDVEVPDLTVAALLIVAAAYLVLFLPPLIWGG